MTYPTERGPILSPGSRPWVLSQGKDAAEMQTYVFQMTRTKMVIEVIHIIASKRKLSK